MGIQNTTQHRVQSENFRAIRSIYEIGEKAIDEVFHLGEISSLQRIVVTANDCDPEISKVGVAAMQSATRHALRLFHAFEEKGFRFAPPLPSENDVIFAGEARDHMGVSQYLQRCIDLAVHLRSKGDITIRLIDDGTAYSVRFTPTSK